MRAVTLISAGDRSLIYVNAAHVVSVAAASVDGETAVIMGMAGTRVQLTVCGSPAVIAAKIFGGALVQ